jgi:predicted SAM-dependent methyltransferase
LRLAGEHPTDRVVRLRERGCENCCGNDLEQLWHQSFTARTRNGLYQFEVNNVVCRNCGFVFVSPVFDEADLSNYYADSFGAFKDASPDYDIDKRLRFLNEVGCYGDLFVEVGANRLTDFHRRLKQLYKKVETVEINDSVTSDHRSLKAMNDACADVVAHYFVLEHIPDVRKFLKECVRVLRESGMMVCEVPDVEVYPEDPSALQLHEHTNHFSREVLRGLAQQVGLVELLVSTEQCSRPFGFVSAFRKSPAVCERDNISQYQRNRELVLAGIRKISRSDSKLEDWCMMLQDYQQSGSGVILWAANDLMAGFLARCSSFSRITIVDSNPEKAAVFRPLEVLTPAAAASEIKRADGIFIFTKFHAADILRQIELVLGKTFATRSVHIVDPFSEGSRKSD